MTAKMLLDTIKTLEVQNIDDDTLDGIGKSLLMIMEDNIFGEKIQGEARTMITKIQGTLAQRVTATQAKQDATWAKAMAHEAEKLAALKAAKKEQIAKRAKTLKDAILKEVAEITDSNEGDALARLKIRAEEDGTLSFMFRGIKWDWNNNLHAWDLTPKKK